jgi:hypothetical protein
MRLSKEAKLDILAMAALRGVLTPLPESKEYQEQVLSRMYDLGGVRLAHSSAEIIERALRYCDKGATLTHIIVNRVGAELDTHITLLISDEDYPITSTEDALNPGGVLGFVYNASYPDCSEMGYVFFEKRKDGTVHRIG